MRESGDQARRHGDDNAQADCIDQHGEKDEGEGEAAGFAFAAHRALARSRRANFWILPVLVLGSSVKIRKRGALNLARCWRQKAMMSSSLTWSWPGRFSTKAQGVSPHFSSDLATTAANRTAGWRFSTFSISMEEIFSPPEMMMSLERSLSWI